MAIIQTRRTVSLKKEVYERLQREARKQKRPLSQLVEDALLALFEKKEALVPVASGEPAWLTLSPEVRTRLQREAAEREISYEERIKEIITSFWADEAPLPKEKREGTPGRYIVNMDVTLEAENPDNAEQKADRIAKRLEQKHLIHEHLVLGADAQ